MIWDVQNRLKEYKYGSTVVESYLYDPDGIRIKKTAGGVATYYVNGFYEVSGSTITKYYYFGGQRIAMRKGGTLTYLHGDHPSAKLRTSLGSTVLETSSTGAITADQKYFAYGKQRDAGPVVTEHKFTGQKLDGTGLMYYQSRYYDPVIGAFISPDTIVPDATNLFDYNRYMYVRGRPLNLSDPTGHFGAEFTGGGSCAQIGMCYTMLSQQAAAKQEAEIALIVQLEASVLFGDVNDIATVLTGYDAISDESVPYLSQEWAETLGWAALPLFSHSGIKAVNEIVEIAGKISMKRSGNTAHFIVKHREPKLLLMLE